MKVLAKADITTLCRASGATFDSFPNLHHQQPQPISTLNRIMAPQVSMSSRLIARRAAVDTKRVALLCYCAYRSSLTSTWDRANWKWKIVPSSVTSAPHRRQHHHHHHPTGDGRPLGEKSSKGKTTNFNYRDSITFHLPRAGKLRFGVFWHFSTLPTLARCGPSANLDRISFSHYVSPRNGQLRSGVPRNRNTSSVSLHVMMMAFVAARSRCPSRHLVGWLVL